MEKFVFVATATNPVTSEQLSATAGHNSDAVKDVYRRARAKGWTCWPEEHIRVERHLKTE